jgi:hypothetical protein
MVVKELRQAVRGQATLGIVYAFLGAQIVVFGLTAWRLDGAPFQAQAGVGFFQVISTIMVVVLLVGVPTYAGIRTHVERVTDHLTMIELTGLGFRKIFWGKFWSAMVVNLLIISTMLPFAFVATLLRGIGLPTVAAVSLVTVLCSAICTVAMLSVGCLMVGVVSRVIWGVICLIGLGFVFGLNFGVNTAAIHAGALSVGGWIACPGGGFLLFAGITLLVLYQSAKHRLTGLSDSQHLRNLEYQPWYVKMQTGGDQQ